jgi:hypothetical protein
VRLGLGLPERSGLGRPARCGDGLAVMNEQQGMVGRDERRCRSAEARDGAWPAGVDKRCCMAGKRMDGKLAGMSSGDVRCGLSCGDERRGLVGRDEQHVVVHCASHLGFGLECEVANGWRRQGCEPSVSRDATVHIENTRGKNVLSWQRCRLLNVRQKSSTPWAREHN